MIWGHWDILGRKNHTRKIDKIYKDFELYQVFMNNFIDKIYKDFELHQVFMNNFIGKNVRIFPLYILLISKNQNVFIRRF